MDHVRISRYTDIGDETLQRSTLQRWYWFGLGRGDRGLQSSPTSLAQHLTELPQLIHILSMHRQLVCGRIWFRAFRMRPTLLRSRTGMQDLSRIRAHEVRSEGYVEGEVEHGLRGSKRSHWDGGQWPLDGWWDRMIAIDTWPTHAKCSRGHLLPAMSSLTGEIAELLHL